MKRTTVLHGGVCHLTSTPHRSGNKMKKIELILCDLIHTSMSVSRSECWPCCLPHVAGHSDRSEAVSHSRLLHRLLSVQLRVFSSATRGAASRDHLRSCDESVPKSAT